MFHSIGLKNRGTHVRRFPPIAKALRLEVECLEGRMLMASGYLAINLVSDQAGVAQIQDPNLVNAWGFALGATGGNFWVSDNETGVTTLYHGDVNGSAFEATAALPVVNIPGSAPTGQVFNPSSSDFIVSDGNGHSGAAAFIFASETGQIFGWSPAVPPPPPSTEAQVAFTASDGAIYKGITIGSNASGTFLFATDFHNGKIDVFDNTFTPTTLAGNFTDSKIPAGFAPFNIQNLGGKLYVTYAKQDDDAEDDVQGAHLGYVDVFNTNGVLLKRLVGQGALNAPWGLALAPANFGKFSKMLLVGNFGDGRINVYDPSTGAAKGTLSDGNGHAIKIDGLWGLGFGNGVTAGDKNALYFTAGPNDEEHGLFGVIKQVDNVSDKVRTTRNLQSFGIDFVSGFLKLENRTGKTISGPLTIEISNVPDGVTLVNAANHAANGHLLITITVDSLEHKETMNVPLFFQGDLAADTSAFFGFHVFNVFSGPFSSSP